MLVKIILTSLLLILSCGGGGESGDVYEGKEDSKLPDVFDAHETDEIEADSFDVHDFGDESNYDEAGYPGEYGEEEAGGDEDGEAEPYDGDIAGVETFVPCYKDSDCDDNDPCTVDKCDPQTGVCASEKKECAAVHLCFIPACGKEGYCFHSPEMSEGCYAELKFGEDFEEADFSNWTVDDLVKNTGEGETPVVWNLDAKRSLSGKQSAYFGIKEKYDFDNGKIVASSLTSPAMKVESPSRIILLFWAYLDVEEGEYWDILSVNVISGEKTIPVWAKKYGTPSKEWFPVEIDLTAFRGIEFSISFVFNSVDDSYNDLEGIYIDGVNLLATGKGAGCVNDGECADSLACTKESCGNGACVYEIAENCCTTDADCDDFDFCTINICSYGECMSYDVADPLCCNKDSDCEDNNDCTVDTCKNNKCSYSVLPVFGCCSKDADCNDNDKCTQDQCVANQCKFANLCCYSDEECDDGDDICTADSCKNNKCVYMPTGIPGCCAPEAASFNFDDGTAMGFEIKNQQSPVGWQAVTGKKYTSPSGALYYGNPLAGNFESGGTNSGTVTSPPIMLQTGYPYELTMQLYMDTEYGTYYDRLEVYIVSEDKPATLVWDKNKLLYMMQFAKVAADVSAWAGSTIQILISFNTIDSIANYGEGVYIDDVAITTPCIAKSCENDTECNDNVASTKDLCSGGKCTYQW